MKYLIMGVMLLLVISSTNALIISEIMYNPDGSDTDREWVELYNDGNSVNMENWKFRENDVNHNLNLEQGSYSLETGEFMIIVDDFSDFLLDYPDYNGNVVSSSFSLRNTGEEIAVLDDSLNVVDSVDYQDLADEGYSLELLGNWQQGKYKGDPGNIPIDNEIPEFSTFGIILIILFVILFKT